MKKATLKILSIVVPLVIVQVAACGQKHNKTYYKARAVVLHEMLGQYGYEEVLPRKGNRKDFEVVCQAYEKKLAPVLDEQRKALSDLGKLQASYDSLAGVFKTYKEMNKLLQPIDEKLAALLGKVSVLMGQSSEQLAIINKLQNQMRQQQHKINQLNRLLYGKTKQPTKGDFDNEKGWKNEDYSIKRTNPQVDGWEGDWYEVYLKNRDTDNKIGFEAKEYTFDHKTKKFGWAINRFRDEVDNIIEQTKRDKYILCVRGEATLSSMTNGKFVPVFDGPEFQLIKVLPYNDTIKLHVDTTRIHEIKEPFVNDDLPNLRAAFVKYLLNNEIKPFKKEEVYILDGKPKRRRIAVIYLYIPEKNKKAQ